MARGSVAAVNLTINPLYNPTEGYGSYIVPAVSILILQQMFLMGTAMLVGTWAEQDRHRASMKTWLARIGLSCFGMVMGCFYYGWVFSMNDYTRNQNLMGSLVLLALFSCHHCHGMCVGRMVWCARTRHANLGSSLNADAVCVGYFLAQMLPTLLQWLRWAILTAGMNAR